MDPEEKIERLLAKNALYPGFVAFLRRAAHKTLAPLSIIDRVAKIEVLRHLYGLDLTSPDIETALGRAEKNEVAAATLNAYRFVLKQWLAYIEVEPDAKERLILRSKKGKRRRKIGRADLLTKEERALIMSTIQSPSIRAYLAVLWDTGARPSEVARMTILDVKEDTYGFIVGMHQTKYVEKTRPVRLLDPDSIAAFSAWWAIHPSRNEPTANLFTGRAGRLSVKAVAKYLGEKFNEKMNRGPGRAKCALTLYLFRKSRATELLKEGLLNETEIKIRMGHERHSSMLHEYYAVLDEDDQAEAELKYLGVQEREEQLDIKKPCPNCGAPNSTKSTRCFRCRQPLTEKELVEEQKLNLRDALRDLLADPATLQAIADAIVELEPNEQEDGRESPKRRKR